MIQAKVEELYKLDRELQHESSTLQSLKQDKVSPFEKHLIITDSQHDNDSY